MSKEFNKQVGLLTDKVFRFARKMLNDHEAAQDVVQDFFEKLWNMRNKLNQYENLEAFSMKVTRNMCLDRLKHEKMKVQKQQLMAVKGDSAVAGDDFTVKDTDQLIKQLVSELPEKQRMALHLRDVEGFEFKEIAEALDMDINAVRMNLSRGRKTVRDQLTKTMSYGL